MLGKNLIKKNNEGLRYGHLDIHIYVLSTTKGICLQLTLSDNVETGNYCQVLCFYFAEIEILEGQNTKDMYKNLLQHNKLLGHYLETKDLKVKLLNFLTQGTSYGI